MVDIEDSVGSKPDPNGEYVADDDDDDDEYSTIMTTESAFLSNLGPEMYNKTCSFGLGMLQRFSSPALSHILTNFCFQILLKPAMLVRLRTSIMAA